MIIEKNRRLHYLKRESWFCVSHSPELGLREGRAHRARPQNPSGNWTGQQGAKLLVEMSLSGWSASHEQDLVPTENASLEALTVVSRLKNKTW